MSKRSEDLLTISLTRVFAASPASVFDAWTNPKHLKNWWKIDEGWAVNIADLDLRNGGTFRLGLRAQDTGDTHVVSGTYYEVVPPRKLVFSFVVEGEEQSEIEERVTVEFSDLHGDTKVDLTHARIRKGESTTFRERSWEAILGNLGAYLYRRMGSAANDV